MLTQVTLKPELTGNASNDEELSRHLIMSDISNSLEYALIAGHILVIKDVVSVYEARIREWGMNDNRGYSADLS